VRPRDAVSRRGGEHGGTVDVNRQCNSLPVTVEQFAAGVLVAHAQISAGTRITSWRSGDRAIGESALALDSSNEPVRTESETVMTLNENKGRTAIKLGFGVASALLFATVGCGNETAGTDDSTQPAPPGSSSGELSATMDEAQQDQVLRLRAKIEVPNQGVVKFYEPQDGVILISEIGRNGIDPMIPPSMSGLPAVQLYETLAKSKAPTPLIEATSRAALLKQRTPSALLEPAVDISPSKLRSMPAASVEPGVVQVSSAITFPNSYDQWFYDNFCSGGVKVGGGWDYVVQWMFATGTGSFQRNDKNWVDSTVSVYGGGSVHYRVQIQPWYSWSTVLDVFIQNGYYHKWHRDNGTDFDVYIYVDQAGGDSYHWCSYGDSW
jgi:hypothetical protein